MKRRSSSYLSRRLDERGGPHTAADRGGPLQEDPGPGDVAPGRPETRQHLPAAPPRHMVGHLQVGMFSSIIS